MWTPASTVTGHQGDRLDPECDFFVLPLREIGAVISAYTSLKRGDEAKPTAARFRTAGVWFAVGYVVGLGLGALFTRTLTPILATFVAFLPAIIGWRTTRLKGFCNFVGAEGCAQFSCRDKHENITEKSVFLFKDAWALSTWRGRRVRDSRHTYTPFYFDWYAYPPETKKRVYSLAGERSSDSQRLPVGDPYKFARAVENAWYDYLIPRIDAEIAQKGSLSFYDGLGRSWVRLGRGFLEIDGVDPEDGPSRWEATDIGSAIAVEFEGTLTLMTQSATEKLYGAAGPLHLNYGNMYNGRVFLYAFEKLVGLSVQRRAIRPRSRDAEQAEAD